MGIVVTPAATLTVTNALDSPTIPPATGGDNTDIGAFEVQPGRPRNVSTRAQVLRGDGVMIAGFIIAGSADKRVIIRGLGPSLGSFAVSNSLADPVLELRASGSLLMANDNWQDAQRDEIAATGIPPTDEREAAIVATLAPGLYTAILSGKNETTGVGLVEVYRFGSRDGLAPAQPQHQRFCWSGRRRSYRRIYRRTGRWRA